MAFIKKYRKSLRLGIAVQALDGQAGRISRLITDPVNHQSTYLVVKSGRVRRREVVVPVSYVSGVSPAAVSLNLTRAELAGFPDYEVRVPIGKYEVPFPVGRKPAGIYTPPANASYQLLRQRSVPDHSVAVRKGMLVRDSDRQEVGKIEGLVLDETTRQGKTLVFRRDSFSPLQVIPTAFVQDVSSSGVMLRIGAKMVEKLPEYNGRTDGLFPVERMDQ